MKKNASKQRRRSKISIEVVVAILGLVGVILAAIIGGIFAVITTQIARPLPTPTSLFLDPTTSYAALRITRVEFVSWRSTLIYGIPSSFDQPILDADLAWDAKRDILAGQGYQVYYRAGDFASVSPLLPPEVNLPTSTIGVSETMPSTPLIIEVWNLNESSPLIIDSLRVELLSFDSPVSDTLELYLLTGPVIGGGEDNSLPTTSFDVVLSPVSKYVDILRENQTRISLPPRTGHVASIDISYIAPGKYQFLVTIDFYFPDGVHQSRKSDTIIYGWTVLDFVDGAKTHLIR